MLYTDKYINKYIFRPTYFWKNKKCARDSLKRLEYLYGFFFLRFIYIYLENRAKINKVARIYNTPVAYTNPKANVK